MPPDPPRRRRGAAREKKGFQSCTLAATWSAGSLAAITVRAVKTVRPAGRPERVIRGERAPRRVQATRRAPRSDR